MESAIEKILGQIQHACQKSGRNPQTVHLVAVSKTHPTNAIEKAMALGLVDFGENKAQELKQKATYFQTHSDLKPRWHYIGNLQRNKAKEIVAYADLFHALDDLRLAETLNRLCAEKNRVLDCLIQVNVSQEETKSGIAPADLTSFLQEVSAFPHLKILGLMTLASPEEDVERVRPQFRLLKQLADAHGLSLLSMGMSDDFEVAIEEGATHIRIGTAIFGHREYPTP